MIDASICDAIRTPIGRYAGALKDVRADDLDAVPLRAQMERSKDVDWTDPIAQKKGDPIVVEHNEHPRATSIEALANLKGVVRPDGIVTA